MKIREKKTVVFDVNNEQMEQAFADFARADARIQKINAEMDIAMVKIREKYQDELNALDLAKTLAFDTLQTYAVEQKDVLFCKRKSIETTHGVIGFRTGTPKLKTLKGFTWASVANLVKEFLPDYIRISEEVAKDKLLADRDADDVAALMPKIGVIVAQDETFYVEPKKEE
jgi:phage host-nuclease inhibitor protein Gam